LLINRSCAGPGAQLDGPAAAIVFQANDSLSSAMHVRADNQLVIAPSGPSLLEGWLYDILWPQTVLVALEPAMVQS